MSDYRVKIGNKEVGTYTRENLENSIRLGEITRAHRASNDGGQTWKSVRNLFPHLFEGSSPSLTTPPPPSPPPQPPQPQPTNTTPGNSQDEVLVADIVRHGNAPNSGAQPGAPNQQWTIRKTSGPHIGTEYGPLTEQEVYHCIYDNRVEPSDLIMRVGEMEWKPLAAVFPMNDGRTNSGVGFAGFICSLLWVFGITSFVGIILGMIGLYQEFSRPDLRPSFFSWAAVGAGVMGILGAIIFFVSMSGF